MSLVPWLFSEWDDLLDRSPHRLLDQHFGTGVQPGQLWGPRQNPYLCPERRNPLAYYRPWANFLREDEEGGSSVVKADKDKFQVVLDVQQFKPDEIDVKVVNNCVVVDAKHEEQRDEHGWISRQFTRKYLIPEQCNTDQVSSELSSDGVLTITAPKKEQPGLENEKSIKIQHTGKPALKSKPTEKEQTAENQGQKKIEKKK